jgi:DNA-binding NarL/FixJ family response regulator
MFINAVVGWNDLSQEVALQRLQGSTRKSLCIKIDLLRKFKSSEELTFEPFAPGIDIDRLLDLCRFISRFVGIRREILILLAKGFSQRETAKILHCHESNVSWHLKKVYGRGRMNLKN